VGILKKLLYFFILIYGGLTIFLYITQDRWVFWPTHKVSLNPGVTTKVSLSYSNVSFTTTDNKNIFGWYIPGKHRATLLYMHGSVGNISDPDRLDYIQALHKLGLDILIFDYRGYGRSQGKPTEEGTYRDAQAAVSYLRNNQGVTPDHLVYFGRELGCAVATWLAAEDPPAALLLDTPFTSMPALAKRTFTFLPIGLIARVHYNTLVNIRKVTCPVFIAHNPDDRKIPISMGEQVYKAAPDIKEFVKINPTIRTESGMYGGQAYMDSIDTFLRDKVNL